MTILILINDAQYWNEKSYIALRLAMALQKDHPTVQVHVFLMEDVVYCALADQITAQGYYNIQRMVKSVISKGGKVKACGTCANARVSQIFSLSTEQRSAPWQSLLNGMSRLIKCSRFD